MEDRITDGQNKVQPRVIDGHTVVAALMCAAAIAVLDYQPFVGTVGWLTRELISLF